MKRFLLLYLVVAGLLIAEGCSTGVKKGIEFYISPSGNDTWSGKLPEPNKQGTDGPFATLEKARDAVRALKKASAKPAGSISIILRGGIYPVGKTLQLTGEDSGTKDSPVVWKAYEGETVWMLGGAKLAGFEPLKDPDALARIGKEFQGNIVQTDLKTQGITDYGEIYPFKGNRAELFFNNDYMSIACYPNEGWLRVLSVPQTGTLVHPGESRPGTIFDGIPAGRHYGKIAYDDDRPARWKFDDDVWMHGYWVWDYQDDFQRIEKLDTVKKWIYPADPQHGYGYRKGCRYYYLHILEELDSPGEWYLDRKNGMLFFWPPEPVEKGEVLFPTLNETMVTFKDASFITMAGIGFECSRACGVTVEGGSGVRIAGCTFRNLGDTCVSVRSGTNHGVVSCDIYNTGKGGIDIDGGDRKTLTPAGNYATNNHVYRYHQAIQKGCGISIVGVGNSATNNRIHEGPYAGIYFYGNDHVFEYNDVYRIGLTTGDVGAIYICGDWTFRGHTIRYNYFHHIKAPGHVGSMSVYLDLPGSETLVYGNIIYKVGRGFYTNSGRDNIIENNIFVECEPAVHIHTWRSPKIYEPGGPWSMWEKLQEMNITQPPYSTRYPKLINIFDADGKGDPAIPEGNRVVRNISWKNTAFLVLSDSLLFDVVAVDSNLVADEVIFQCRKGREKVEYTRSDAEMVAKFAEHGNVIIDGDPGFVDVEHENFNLKEDSPALKLGFKPIPFDKIGLYLDEYRKTIPEKDY